MVHFRIRHAFANFSRNITPTNVRLVKAGNGKTSQEPMHESDEPNQAYITKAEISLATILKISLL
jgi:hypothetical protein